MRKPASDIVPDICGASMVIRGASTVVPASSLPAAGIAAVPPAASARLSRLSASASAICSAMTCWRAASRSSSGPTKNTCQPNNTAIDSVIARIRLRFSGFMRLSPSSYRSFVFRSFVVRSVGNMSVAIRFGAALWRFHAISCQQAVLFRRHRVKGWHCPRVATRDTF